MRYLKKEEFNHIRRFGIHINEVTVMSSLLRICISSFSPTKKEVCYEIKYYAQYIK